LISRLLGFTFGVKLLERGEHEARIIRTAEKRDRGSEVSSKKNMPEEA
jgi:hypothetical protein